MVKWLFSRKSTTYIRTSDTQGSQIGAVSKDTETMLQQNEPTIQPENERLHYYMVQKQEMRKFSRNI